MNPTETNATAEIIQPPLPPLPECVVLMQVGQSWTPGIAGTREECNEFVNDDAYTYAIITLTPPAPVRTAASINDVLDAYQLNGWGLGMYGLFKAGWRAAERHHGIGGGQ